MVKTLFQASTWNALALGNFDTVISVRELLRCADTGVGIGTALDGVITLKTAQPTRQRRTARHRYEAGGQHGVCRSHGV